MVTKKKDAPGELELVRVFVNTLDVESGEDGLAGTAALREWLSSRGLLERTWETTAEDVARAVAAREALRALLLANNGAAPDPAAAATLDRAARRARLALRFLPDGSARQEPAAGGVDGALGRLLAIVAAAMADGTWPRLKACRSDACRWAFYDHARNRSRTWCDMAVCGNRVKARTYRKRRRAGS
jgi:predicted RNA-binding Zn ribbon-like protein